MRCLLLLVAPLAFVSIASSQAYVTAPAGFLKKSAGYYTSHPFWLLEGRWQVGDPTIPKGKILTLLAVDYRTNTFLTYQWK